MSNLNGRLAKLEQQLARQPDPETDNSELIRELDALDAMLLSLSKAEVLAWIDEQLAHLKEDSGWLDILGDWKEFLTLKGQNTVPTWDNHRAVFIETENSKRWGELQRKWGWPACWTGAGAPPQLIPGHSKFLF